MLVKKMLKKCKNIVKSVYGHITFEEFDITNYIWTPNFGQCAKLHLGGK